MSTADRLRLFLVPTDCHSGRRSPRLTVIQRYGEMAEVTISYLRNHGGKVIDRVQAGDRLTVTRNGRPVAELRPLPPKAVQVDTLLRRWSRLPVVDYRRLRSDLDRLAKPSV